MNEKAKGRWLENVPTISGTIDDLIERATAFVETKLSTDLSCVNPCLEIKYDHPNILDFSLSLYSTDEKKEREFSEALKSIEHTENNHYSFRKLHDLALDFFKKGFTVKNITSLQSDCPLLLKPHNSFGELAEKIQSLKSKVPLGFVYGGKPIFFPMRGSDGIAWTFYDVGKELYSHPSLSPEENLERHLEDVHEGLFGKLCSDFDGRPSLVDESPSNVSDVVVPLIQTLGLRGKDSIRQSIYRIFNEYSQWVQAKGDNNKDYDLQLSILYYPGIGKLSPTLHIWDRKTKKQVHGLTERVYDYDSQTTEWGIAKAVVNHLKKFKFSLDLHGVEVIERGLLGVNHASLYNRKEANDYANTIAVNLRKIHATYVNGLPRKSRPTLTIVPSLPSPSAGN